MGWETAGALAVHSRPQWALVIDHHRPNHYCIATLFHLNRCLHLIMILNWISLLHISALHPGTVYNSLSSNAHKKSERGDSGTGEGVVGVCCQNLTTIGGSRRWQGGRRNCYSLVNPSCNCLYLTTTLPLPPLPLSYLPRLGKVIFNYKFDSPSSVGPLSYNRPGKTLPYREMGRCGPWSALTEMPIIVHKRKRDSQLWTW